MKKILINMLIVFLLTITIILPNSSFGQSKNDINSYVSFLQKQKTSAKDYVLNLFKDHDIVILCERTHTEMTQYDLVKEIISDKRFIKNVGNVFTEIGLSTLNPELNEFLHTRNLPDQTVDEKIRYFQRNCSFWPLWANTNYNVYLHNLYQLNNKLSPNEQINAYPSDLPLRWKDTDSLVKVKLKPMIGLRDSIIAAQIITKFNEIRKSGQKRKKALVILNYRHAFNQEFIIVNRTLKNAAYFLFKEYGNRVANIMLNSISVTMQGNFEMLQNGKWDAAFQLTGKDNIGFSFQNSPFAKDSFDFWPYKNEFKYENVFTGFVFYLPIEKHFISEGVSNLLDSAYMKEYYRRSDLISSFGGEFAKVSRIKEMIQKDPEMMKIYNSPANKQYYMLDSLLEKRKIWEK